MSIIKKWMINPTWMILLSMGATATKRSGSGQASCRVVRTAVNAESLLSSTRPGGTERNQKNHAGGFLEVGYPLVN